MLAGLAVTVAISHQETRDQVFQVQHIETLLPRAKKVLPAAQQVGKPSATLPGAYELLTDEGQLVGVMLQTSPTGDRAIGFSGSTNILLICNANLEILSAEILTSGDTRDHVAAVLRDKAYWKQFNGMTPEAIAASDHSKSVAAGATLTSLAIIEAINLRLGGRSTGARFVNPPTLPDLQILFPAATRLEQDSGSRSVLRLYDANEIPLGWALRTSPEADEVIGYQGPTDSILAFDAAGQACGLIILASFDNEPYVGYVRDDAQFSRLFAGKTFEQLADLSAANPGVEGVSGATMTSQAIAEAILKTAAAEASYRKQASRHIGMIVLQKLSRVDPPQWGAICIMVMGVITGFTRLRGSFLGRIILPLAVLCYLGFGAGAVLSQAQLWGWARVGIPQAATVLLFLTAIALVVPVTTGRNIYCSHLCSHGAAQQLLARTIKPRRHPSLNSLRKPLQATLQRLRWVPITLLVIAFGASFFQTPLNLVDLEPFDAYLPAVAGTAAFIWFGISLATSSLVPMAYCRYGCPTGVLLDHVRFHRRSDKLSWHDGVLAVCLITATLVILSK